jgi:RHS repeat-associated protein
MKELIKLLTVASFWLATAMTANAGSNTKSITYVYTDPQGTPLAEADVNGNVTATFDYAPYGSIALGTAPNGPGYTGHVNDPDTGFVYMQARYYDPAVGRFLSVDPVAPVTGNAFNFNRYAYAKNNPIVNIDPNGKQETPAEESIDPDVDSSGFPKLGINMGTASPFEPMRNESSSDFTSRQNYAFERMDSTPAKNAQDDAKAESVVKTYQTYTKTNPTTGEVYSGKTSGTGDPQENVAGRDSGHHMNDKGFGPAELDKSSANPDAIRGREQQNIIANGGAKSQGGTSGNAINGVSPTNPKASTYENAANDPNNFTH